MNFTDEAVVGYMRKLCGRYDEAVLQEMEERAEKNDFPIIGRLVGPLLEVAARAVGARRVLEMGSGYGYSAYWFARAAGEAGEVVLTDGDPANAALAEEYLTKAGLWSRCRFMVGDAIESLRNTEGDFDVVYCDIDKSDYPRAFTEAKQRVRPGGLYICDNVLWSGRVARDDDDAWTQAIRQQNEMIYADENWLPTILPQRDGVMLALRLR
jgi:predicted O-methyltransferase YrrM